VSDFTKVERAVNAIIERVRKDGDNALFYYSEKFDGIRAKEFKVPEIRLKKAFAGLSTGEKKALRKAARYGFFVLPMDESCALAAIDLSGRSSLMFDAKFESASIEGFPSELAQEFMQAFCREAKCGVFVRLLCGSNEHHKAEAIFKCLGRALREAVRIDEKAKGEIPSTKGKL